MTTHDTERRALMNPVILLLLAERPGHGYELTQRLGAFGWAEAESAHVYRLLRGMEKGGQISSQWRASVSGPARREYEITPAGSMSLSLWFVRLGELHSTLHLFLERYVQLSGPGSGPVGGEARPTAGHPLSGHPPTTGRTGSV
ncbi:helix-turn-helix transcriptional regulator [Streptomyces sp. NPDC059479]|uniref:helix-turn-helix transcriptional regulator n=2 Tax=unclassified Streptomyces TaxID=2593676 RepID=UPI0036620F4C